MSGNVEELKQYVSALKDNKLSVSCSVSRMTSTRLCTLVTLVGKAQA